MNRIRHLEGKIEDLETRLGQLKYDLEREVDDRRGAVRQLANDITDVYSATNS